MYCEAWRSNRDYLYFQPRPIIVLQSDSGEIQIPALSRDGSLDIDQALVTALQVCILKRNIYMYIDTPAHGN